MSDRFHELFREGSTLARTLPKSTGAVTMRDLAMWLGLMIGAYALLLYSGFALAACAVAYVMITKAQYALLLTGHEASHHSLFANKSLNDFIGAYICFGPVGIGFNVARAAHLDHHAYLLTEKDVKLDQQIANPTKQRLLVHLMRPLFGYYLFKATARLFGITIESRVKPVYVVTAAQRKADFIAIILSSVILFGILTIIDWRLYLFFWIAPLFTLTAFLHNARAMVDHVKMPDEPEGLLYSYPVTWFDRMLFGVQSYRHAEHHLWPQVPYAHLPKLEPITRQMPNVKHRGSALACLIEYYRRLPSKGRLQPERIEHLENGHLVDDIRPR